VNRLTLFSICVFCAAPFAAAQPPVSRTSPPVGNSGGETSGNYNVVNNVELGYRFHTVGGSENQYRSSVNYGNGVRLLGSSLAVNSVDGHGTLFDQIVLTTLGLGNDPYQFAQFRVERNAIYRYDLNWRENQYFNPGLLTSGGASVHLTNTTFGMQDHNLTILPQSRFKFFFGYTGTAQLGPAYTTENIGIQRSSGQFSNEFNDVRRRWNEYRVGNEFSVAGIRVNWIRGWEDFKEDTAFTLASTSVPGFAPNANLPQLGLRKADPSHGTSPYWRVALFTGRKMFDINSRFTYTSGRRDFVLDDTILTAAGPAITTTRVFNSGNAQRPVATGNLNLGFHPSTKLSILNSTAVYNARTQGNSTFVQYSPGQSTLVDYDYLGIRTVSNDTVVNYQASKMLGFFAGYHYSDRFIRSVEIVNRTTVHAEQTDVLNSENFGLRLRPVQDLTIQLDAEIGRSDRPFSPIAPRNYNALNGRIGYRARNFQFTGTTNTDYNNNSVALSTFASKSRRYAADGSWTPRGWFTIDAGYSKMHLDTVGGIAYVVTGVLNKGDRSFYFSNIHTVYAGIRVAYKDRADLYLGLTRVEDTGDGRATSAGGAIGSARPVFQVVQTFPLLYQSPMARVSLKVMNKLRWNAGYQYYGYRQEFNLNPNLSYQANTGYTSLSFAF
jgi:hypothetical protein